MKVLVVSSISLLSTFILPTLAVKGGDFKTCDKSAFCRRGRALAQRAKDAGNSWHSPYSIDPASIQISPTDSSFSARVVSELYPDINFQLEVRAHEDGVFRVRMDEVNGLRKRYDEAAAWALMKEPRLASGDNVKWTQSQKKIKAKHGNSEVVVQFSPLRISLSNGGTEDIVLNGSGLLHMEHFRQKDEPKVEEKSEESSSETERGSAEGEQVVMSEVVEPKNERAWFEGETEDGYWSESFLQWTDSKPKGPESLSLDIAFPGHPHLYGIPQHAAPLDLPTTTGEDAFFSDPYRLWNMDVFEYEASSTISLYGSVPLLHAQSERSTVGIFNAIASETWIDVSHPDQKKSSLSHWVSESGILDVFLLPGPTPEAVFKQYATLTGTAPLPPAWSLGHHQCRWNYINSADMREVAKKFDENEMPMDVLWLDIEYSEEHKYFIWEESKFPDPVEMVNDIAAVERKVVVIVDPHLKRVDNYPVYKEAKDKGLVVKRSDGNEDFEGWCWSGSSAWVDFFHPGSWSWWQGLFSLSDKDGVGWRWKESTDKVHIWNDMNEPSVFNGPEITMQKDLIHYGGWEHRDVHNVNGMLFNNQTFNGVKYRGDKPTRPFTLSRSFFAGSQRFGAVWTGDNMGTWEHMTVGVQMTLADSIGGITFIGSDVGGFFGNPPPDMLVRWYQVGAFAPFFRAHAHIDTKRREPYLLEEPYKSYVRDILKLRYSLLPVWYTAFRETSVNGMPVMRPQYVMFPKDKKGFALDDQYYIGSSGLLVKPVTSPDVSETSVYLAEDQVYYDYFSYEAYRGASKGKNVTVSAPLEKVPLLIRGGSILATRQRHRRSSPLMKYDPFTLTIALDKTGRSASGELYLDDGESYSYLQGDLLWRGFNTVKHGRKGIQISNVDLAKSKPAEAVEGEVELAYNSDNTFAKTIKEKKVGVEKIIVLGLEGRPKEVSVRGSLEKVEWTYEPATKSKASILVVKKPGVFIADEWSLEVDA